MACRGRRTGLFFAVLPLFAFTSCASYAASSGAYTPPPTELVVQNRGWETVTVFAMRGPAAVRIGSVEGMATRTFVLSPAITGPAGLIQLKGRRRITGEEFLSHSFDMGAGSRAQWTIESNARLSSLMVR